MVDSSTSEVSVSGNNKEVDNTTVESEVNLKTKGAGVQNTENIENHVSEESKESEFKTKKDNLFDRFKYIKRNITVEPILGCYFVPSVLSLLCAQNVYLDKACRNNLNFSNDVCDAIKARETQNYTKEEVEVQQLVASVLAWKSIVQTSIPCLIILFAGTWSDIYRKRKIFIIAPILGELTAYSSFVVVLYVFEHVRVEVLAVLEALPQALSGGWFVMLMGIFSYISDITTEENRTFRIGIVNVFMSLGVPFGTSLSGFLLKSLDYYGAFLVSIIMYSISLLYGIFKIQDVPIPVEVAAQSRITVFASFFNLKGLKCTWDVLFKQDRLGKKIRILLILFLVFIVFGPLQGKLAVQYLYLTYKFGWNEVSYSLFSTYSMLMYFIGNSIALALFCSRWKFEDASIGIIASVSTISSTFLYIYSTSTLQIYFAPILEIFNGTSDIALRSIASKAVCSRDRGKLISLFGMAESLTPVMFSPLYLHIYTHTLSTFPGAVFYTTTALSVLAVVVYMWLYKEREKRLSTRD